MTTPVPEDIFDRIDRLRLELKQDIIAVGSNMAQNQAKLEAKFDTLEAGRLTRSEAKIRDIEVKMAQNERVSAVNQAVLSTKVFVLWSMAVAIVTVGAEYVAHAIFK